MGDVSSKLSRREFVEIVAGSSLAFAAVSSLCADHLVLSETADLILGPFYPQVKPRDTDADLTLIRGNSRRASGEVIQLSGNVVNVRGEPVRNVVIEVWQANKNGRYAHASDPNTHLAIDPDFQGYARIRTDDAGRYSLTTIKPGPYPTPRGDMRAPHIHFEIAGRVDRKVTQLFFPDEPLNDQDRHLRSVRRPETLIASVSASADRANVLLAHWDIVLTNG